MKLTFIFRATAVASCCCLANAQLVGGGDDCNLPDAISGPGSFFFDNSLATTGAEGQSESICYEFGTTTVITDVWFDWTSTFTGTAKIDTCGSPTDTKIAAYPGAGCPTTGTALDCNDDSCGWQSAIQIPVVSGQVYAIQVGLYPFASGGTGNLNIAEHVPVPFGLVGHWDFNETSGLIVHDSSGNVLDATLQGGVTLGHPGAFPGTGTAALFDPALLGLGVIPDQAPLDGLLEELTLAAWVRTSATPSAPERIFGGDGSAWSVGILATGLRFTTTGIQDFDLSATYPIDQWFHVACVFDSGHDVTFYVDGSPVGTVNGGGASNPAVGQWLIGAFRSGGITNECWNGYLDDIQVYSGALTDADIDYLFQHPGATVGGDVGTQYCAGDGTGTTCPCVNNNNGDMGGCDWGDLAFPEGGVLDATGSASMASNDCLLVATGVANNFGIFFGADNQVNGGNGNPLNDGLRCAGGALVRLIPPTMASGNQLTLPAPVQTLDTGAASGVTRRYQYWFRTPSGPCGQMANLTNGYEIVWVP